MGAKKKHIAASCLLALSLQTACNISYEPKRVLAYLKRLSGPVERMVGVGSSVNREVLMAHAISAGCSMILAAMKWRPVNIC